jgi:hypothetical protein
VVLDYVLATLNQAYLHLMNVKASRIRLVLLQIVTGTVATDMLHIVPGARMDQPDRVPSGQRRWWMILKLHSGKWTMMCVLWLVSGDCEIGTV